MAREKKTGFTSARRCFPKEINDDFGFLDGTENFSRPFEQRSYPGNGTGTVRNVRMVRNAYNNNNNMNEKLSPSRIEKRPADSRDAAAGFPHCRPSVAVRTKIILYSESKVGATSLRRVVRRQSKRSTILYLVEVSQYGSAGGGW